MQLTPRLLLYVFMACIAASPAQAQQVGLLPVPVFQNAQIQAVTTFDAGSQFYTFAYTISNPATNTGQIVNISVDITRPAGSLPFASSGLTIPIGRTNISFDNFVSMINPPPMVPVGMKMPTGWIGALAVGGFAFFHSGDPRTTGTDMISPGQIKGGFALISPGVPTIRQIKLIPDWVLVTASEATAEEEQRAQATEDSLPITTQTLGPSAMKPGSSGHWDQIRDDLNRAIQLKWITDPALAKRLVDQLASARQAKNVSDSARTKASLQLLMDLAARSTPGQIRQEARDLVLLNARAIIAVSLK